jgi:DNA polymerase elongation subunit (family B)
MLKYIKTKSGKVYKCISSHSEIMKYNRLSYTDILDEGIIINGKMQSIYKPMDKQVIKARELESKLMYNSYYRIGD